MLNADVNSIQIYSWIGWNVHELSLWEHKQTEFAQLSSRVHWHHFDAEKKIQWTKNWDEAQKKMKGNGARMRAKLMSIQMYKQGSTGVAIIILSSTKNWMWVWTFPDANSFYKEFLHKTVAVNHIKLLKLFMEIMIIYKNLHTSDKWREQVSHDTRWNVRYYASF